MSKLTETIGLSFFSFATQQYRGALCCPAHTYAFQFQFEGLELAMVNTTAAAAAGLLKSGFYGPVTATLDWCEVGSDHLHISL